VRLLLERGEFSSGQAMMTATAVRYFGAGLLSFAWVKVCVQGFYATHDTRTPVIVAASSMLLNIALILMLVGPLGFRGLATATATSYSVNAIMLYALLSRRYGLLCDAHFAGALGRIVLATLLMCAAVYAAQRGVHAALPEGRFAVKLLHVAAPAGIGASVYFSACYVLRIEELQDFLQIVRRRAKV
jgi:putative peptidoglycan lipid II flippase